MATGDLSQCVTCGHELAGEYCHARGEHSQREPPTLLRFIVMNVLLFCVQPLANLVTLWTVS